jgi:hypothetical protein
MFGDERVRHCSSCNLNVYNLSGMTRREVSDLVHLAEGRLCIRFFRRKDGTLLTADCPIGMKVISPLARIIAFALAAAIPIWGTFVVVNWRDVQASISGWWPAGEPAPSPCDEGRGSDPPHRTPDTLGVWVGTPPSRGLPGARSPRANGAGEERMPGRAPSDPGPLSPPIRVD